MRYIGFDMGDGESAVAAFERGSGIEPMILPVCGVGSLLSAVGTVGGETVVGERAYTDALASGLSVRFKSRFTYDPTSYEDIVRFVRGVFRELADAGALNADDRYVVGCPAGWNAASRARYRDLLLRAGVHEPQVISESRAAFLYAKYAKTVALDVDVLNQSALVVDIGSSTLDFAYIVDGRETGVGTFGDVALGGGLLDEELLRRAVQKSRDREAILRVFDESRSWRSFCEIEARRVKETFYTRFATQEDVCIKKQVRVCYDGVQKLEIKLDAAEADALVHEPLNALEGRSFVKAVRDALENAARVTADKPPKLVLLTGGASRMPFFRDQCRDVFSSAVVVCCPEPEYSIAKGLAYAGWVDENLRAFRQAIKDEMTDERLKAMVREALPALMPGVIDALITLLIDEAALPIANQWKAGEIDTLAEMQERMRDRMTRVLESPLANEALAPVVSLWLKGLNERLQAMVDPICDRYEVPRKEMKIDLNASGTGSVTLETNHLVGLNVLGTVVGVVVSVAVALLCGGEGVALIAVGPLGFLAGLAIGAAVAALGWKAVSDALMKAKIPRLMRNVNFEKKLGSEATRTKLREQLKKELDAPDSPFTTKLEDGFAKAFGTYLYGVAQAAEISIE